MKFHCFFLLFSLLFNFFIADPLVSQSESGVKNAVLSEFSFDLLNKTGESIVEVSVRQSFSDFESDDMLNGEFIADGSKRRLFFYENAKKQNGFWDIFCTGANGNVYIIFGVNFRAGDAAALIVVSAEDAAEEAL